jgi:ribosomal protein S14
MFIDGQIKNRLDGVRVTNLLGFERSLPHRLFSFAKGADMHRKASCSCLNQNNATKYGASKIYPAGRRCKECGQKLSIYNGMNICNICWSKSELAQVDYAFGAELEHNLLGVGR